MNLAKLNLNLLLSLQALLSEGSVTRAAQRLHVTQSAMSKSLAQLRELFNDPLLVRTYNTTQPTRLALDLHRQVDAVLQDIERMLQPAEFDPATCEHSFTLVAEDYESQFLLPQIFHHLYQAAPGLSLRLLHLDEQVNAGLASGLIDLCFGTLESPAPQTRSHRVFTDHMVCVMSDRHPLISAPLTLDGYCSYPHVVNSSVRGGMLNDILATLGRYRHIRLETPLFHSALRLIVDGETLVTLPAHIARQVCPGQGLTYRPLPFASPLLEYGLIWPAQMEGQASHRWLRETLIQRMTMIMDATPSQDKIGDLVPLFGDAEKNADGV